MRRLFLAIADHVGTLRDARDVGGDLSEVPETASVKLGNKEPLRERRFPKSAKIGRFSLLAHSISFSFDETPRHGLWNMIDCARSSPDFADSARRVLGPDQDVRRCAYVRGCA